MLSSLPETHTGSSPPQRHMPSQGVLKAIAYTINRNSHMQTGKEVVARDGGDEEERHDEDAKALLDDPLLFL